VNTFAVDALQPAVHASAAAHQPAKLMVACGATLRQQTCRSPRLMIAAHLVQGLLLTDSSERMDSLNLLR